MAAAPRQRRRQQLQRRRQLQRQLQQQRRRQQRAAGEGPAAAGAAGVAAGAVAAHGAAALPAWLERFAGSRDGRDARLGGGRDQFAAAAAWTSRPSPPCLPGLVDS